MLLNQNIKWSVDTQHSSIHFKVRHMMIAHIRGQFRQFDASIYITNNDFTTAEIDFWIGAASIDTGNKERDEHLRSAAFFDTDRFPQISFVSGTIGKQNDKGVHELWGTLTIKGVSKKVLFEVEYGGTIRDTNGWEKSGFQAEAKINRTDWGVLFNTPLETEGVMLGQAVHISCEIELIAEHSNEPALEHTRNRDNRFVM